MGHRLNTTRSWKGQEGFFLEPLEEAQLCQHLDFVDSKMVRK